MSKLIVCFGIGNIAARRHIKIVNLKTVFERRADVAGIAFAAIFVGTGFLEREARENSDPVIALLAVDRLMRVSHFPKGIAWKELVWAFRFLQAQNIKLCLFQKTKRLRGPQANGIDVPSSKTNGAHLFP